MGIDTNVFYRGIDVSLDEIIRKRAIFYGKAAHTSVNFEDDVNALNVVNPTIIVTNFLKENRLLGGAIRVNCVVHEGGQMYNTVTYQMQLEIYMHTKG